MNCPDGVATSKTYPDSTAANYVYDLVGGGWPGAASSKHTQNIFLIVLRVARSLRFFARGGC